MKGMVLGSGTCVPTKRRGAPGYALFIKGQWVLIDSGSGTIGRLATAEIDYRDIAGVFYTHWHPDHTGDLESLLNALNFTPGFTRTNQLQIFGPTGFLAFYNKLRDAYPWISPTTYPLQITEVGDQAIDFPYDAVIQSKLVQHSSDIPSVGYRFSCPDGIVVFTGDTKFCQAAISLSDSADLLVIEASVPFERHNPGNHLTAGQAGMIANLAKARNVLLTHFYPVCDEYDVKDICASEYEGNIILAEDLMEFSLSKHHLSVRTIDPLRT